MRIQINVRNDMDIVYNFMVNKVDNIGKVGEMARLGIMLMLHISLKSILSHPKWMIPISISHLVLIPNDLQNCDLRSRSSRKDQDH